MGTLQTVAFDIETTGLGVEDEITAVGFALPLGCRVFVRGDTDANRVRDGVSLEIDTHVSASTHTNEESLLRAVEGFASNRINGEDVLLVAYNGEKWNGGFDLPFLRTRLASSDIMWPFRDVPYTDLLPIVKKMFNTTRDGEDYNDLVSAYRTLVGDGLNDTDPFVDSSEAVKAYEAGRTGELVQHNIADVLRTRAIAQVAEQYCSKSDFRLKSLTPTIHDI